MCKEGDMHVCIHLIRRFMEAEVCEKSIVWSVNDVNIMKEDMYMKQGETLCIFTCTVVIRVCFKKGEEEGVLKYANLHTTPSFFPKPLFIERKVIKRERWVHKSITDITSFIIRIGDISLDICTIDIMKYVEALGLNFKTQECTPWPPFLPDEWVGVKHFIEIQAGRMLHLMKFQVLRVKDISTLTRLQFLIWVFSRRRKDICPICLDEETVTEMQSVMFYPCGHTMCKKQCFFNFHQNAKKTCTPLERGVDILSDAFAYSYNVRQCFECPTCRQLVKSVFVVKDVKITERDAQFLHIPELKDIL